MPRLTSQQVADVLMRHSRYFSHSGYGQDPNVSAQLVEVLP
jgi:hypothetical protein